MKALGVLIGFDMEEVRDCLNILLQDKATKHNIIWATDTYADYSALFADDAEITPEILKGAYSRLIQPRVAKAANDQNDRTRMICMFHIIKNIYAISEYRLCIQFSEGETKIYDVFKALEDKELFACVGMDVGGYGVVWNDEIDISCNELFENGTSVTKV